MKRIALALALAAMTVGASPTPRPKNPTVVISTAVGDITVELYADKAPISVKNFLGYADSGFYDGTVFHRVVPGFVIQGGGFTEEMEKKPVKAPIKNEAGNGLKNEVGTLAMARTSVVDSATSQFFVNLKDNGFLNHRSDRAAEFGYAVFGRVTKGMEVVRKIEAVKTGNRGPYKNLPVEPVIIKSVTKEE